MCCLAPHIRTPAPARPLDRIGLRSSTLASYRRLRPVPSLAVSHTAAAVCSRCASVVGAGRRDRRTVAGWLRLPLVRCCSPSWLAEAGSGPSLARREADRAHLPEIVAALRQWTGWRRHWPHRRGTGQRLCLPRCSTRQAIVFFTCAATLPRSCRARPACQPDPLCPLARTVGTGRACRLSRVRLLRSPRCAGVTPRSRSVRGRRAAVLLPAAAVPRSPAGPRDRLASRSILLAQCTIGLADSRAAWRHRAAHPAAVRARSPSHVLAATPARHAAALAGRKH